jgi:hypothetical protein
MPSFRVPAKIFWIEPAVRNEEKAGVAEDLAWPLSGRASQDKKINLKASMLPRC